MVCLLRTVKYCFLLSCKNVVYRLYPHHHGVIHITDLVAPSSKPPARVNSFVHECWLKNRKGVVTPERRNGIGVGHLAMVLRDDAALITLLQHTRPNQSIHDIA